ncbi:MAG: DUF2202 domain-containing protein [Peptococcaceae bacterium]|nr:DUF2202 domain-containing protein [Peptococcaceae bacterium]
MILLTILTLPACSTITAVSANQPAESSVSNSLVTQNTTDAPSAYGAAAALKDSNLKLDKMLEYAIEDEYLAHAEYEYIIQTYGNQKPFSNIILAEEKHIGMLTPLFTKYQAVLPQNQAKSLVPHPQSLKEALEAGVQAEIANIAMYENFLKLQLPDEIRVVFTQLKEASQSHLAAFKRGNI